MSWKASTKALACLAEKWNISGEVKIPKRRGLFPGLLQEQGPKGPSLKTPGLEDPERGFKRLTVNGNRLGFRTILDAVAFVQGVLPVVQCSKDRNRSWISGQREDLRIKHTLQLAHVHLSEKRCDAALNLIEPVLRDHPYEVELLCPTIDILLAQDRLVEAQCLISQLLSFNQDPALRKKYAPELETE